MTDDELVEQLKNGNQGAFESLYERHAHGLLRHLYHLFGNQEEAEEILHESLMLMIQKINFYTPNPELLSSFKAWLYRISTNRAIDEIRKRKKRPIQFEDEVASESLGQEDFILEKEQVSLISELIMKLPVMQRMVLNLRVQEDLSYTEISVILGKDLNSIKQGLFQARKSIKQLLLAHGELL
jgi:RNA polymerase sigma factor (sigma-70 family)